MLRAPNVKIRAASFLCAGSLTLLALAAYGPALRGQFLWDDDDHVAKLPALESPHGLRDIWSKPGTTPQYYPLTFTAFWLQYRLWGLNPAGYHAVNLLLHLVNAFLLWRLFRWLAIPAAGFAAALFLLHPIHVMSVAWITELKNVLSCLFYLLSLLAWLRCENILNATGTRSRRLYALSLVLFLLALLAKTAAASLPLALLLVLWWKQGRIERRVALAVAPFFTLALIFGGFTLWYERHFVEATGAGFDLALLERLYVAGRSFWFYLIKLLWPHPLAFFYARWDTLQHPLLQVMPFLGAMFLLAALWLARHRLGRAPFAAMLFFALSSPFLVLVQKLYMMRYSYVADHWIYFSSPAVLALAAATVRGAMDRWLSRPRELRALTGIVVLLVLAFLTRQQTHIYRDTVTLYTDTLAKDPGSWVAHNNLGIYYLGRGEVAQAEAHYRLAVDADPGSAASRHNLGALLLHTARTEDAIACFREAVRLDREEAASHRYLGVALYAAGRFPEAMDAFAETLALQPADPQALLYRGLIFMQEGDEEAAWASLQRAVAAYESGGRIDRAEAVATQALQVAEKQGQTGLAARLRGALETMGRSGSL